MVEFELSKGICLLDKKWADYFSDWYLGCRKSSQSGYYVYARERVDGKYIVKSVHREVLGAKKGQHVDHINGDTLDNRECNLRIATRSQNAANSQKQRVQCTSRHKNVTYLKTSIWPSKWKAQIKKDGKYYSKLFLSEMEAAEWAKMKHLELFGEYSYFAREANGQAN